jgi:hypothetical protein
MAAATQTARTSPQNSKMSSPKDSKNSLPIVTKTEGVYMPSLLPLPDQHWPMVAVPALLPTVPALRITAPYLVIAMRKHD